MIFNNPNDEFVDISPQKVAQADPSRHFGGVSNKASVKQSPSPKKSRRSPDAYSRQQP